MSKFLLITLFLSLVGCMDFEWGYHFEFTNQLSKPVDSLQIVVGDQAFSISSHDSSGNLYGNLDLPLQGEKAPVRIVLFTGKNTIELQADSFGNFNADGTHEYELKEPYSKYTFHN